MAAVLPSPTIQVKFNYIAALDRYKHEKPYRINDIELDPGEEIPLTNIEVEKRSALLNDIRSYRNDIDLEVYGFKYVDFVAKTVPTFTNASIEAYSNEMIELLRKHVDAAKVICYDLRLRKHNPGPSKVRTFTDRSIPDAPIEAVHIDHTKSAGWSRLAHHMTAEERQRYFDGHWRMRIFNIWKPLNRVIQDMPLAICDPRTVSEMDLIEVDQVGPGFVAEIYYVRHNPNHKWFWLRNQTSEEALIFRSWDSHPPEAQLNFCPHASFKDPNTPLGVPLRESVEVRLVTFTKRN